MSGIVTLMVAAIVAGVVGIAGGEPVRPVVHDEASRLLGELTDQLRGLGGQLERHLRGGPGGPGPGGPPPGVAERPLVSFMLEHRTELGLSGEQVARLEALRSDFMREAIRREAEIRIAELDLAALLEQDPLDLGRVEAKVREVAQLRADLRIGRLRTIEQGKGVLTAEQRTRLQSLLGGPRGPSRAAARDLRL